MTDAAPKIPTQHSTFTIYICVQCGMFNICINWFGTFGLAEYIDNIDSTSNILHLPLLWHNMYLYFPKAGAKFVPVIFKQTVSFTNAWTYLKSNFVLQSLKSIHATNGLMMDFSFSPVAFLTQNSTLKMISATKQPRRKRRSILG